MKNKDYKYKLKNTIYINSDNCIDIVKDESDDWSIYARKGQLAKRVILTNENVNKYLCDTDIDYEYNVVYEFTNGRYVFIGEDEDEFFEKIK